MEIWKPVRQFEGLYEISDSGSVRRVQRGKKFTSAQVDEAKTMFCNGSDLPTVAAFLSTSITTAFNIKHGKTWAGDTRYRAVKASPGSDHYLRFAACKNGVYTRVSVHRAIWEAFVGPIEGRMEINHKNLSRTDNRLENLELVTHRENIRHAHNVYREERKHLPKGHRKGAYGRYCNAKHG